MHMHVEFWGQEFKINVAVGCAFGLLMAVVSSMFGFGGGPFMIAIMTLALGMPMYLAVGSSLLVIFFNTVTGTVRHYQFGNFDLTFFLVMFPAAILGGYIGPQITKRVSPVVVKRIAVAGLTLLALNLLGVY
jgi:uncharacterized membrane protein YfcA